MQLILSKNFYLSAELLSDLLELLIIFIEHAIDRLIHGRWTAHPDPLDAFFGLILELPCEVVLGPSLARRLLTDSQDESEAVQVELL